MSITKQVTINMAEDLTYLLGYSYVNKWMNEQLAEYFPDEVDENGRPTQNIAREVIAGGASYLLMSGMMRIIEREEKFIEYLFASAEAIITVLYLRNKGAFDRISNRIKSMKGIKAINRLNLFNSQTDNQNSYISQVYQMTQAIMQGRSASQDVAQTISASNSTQSIALQREKQNFMFAQQNNKQFHDSLFVKLATGTFTQTDEAILRKVVGRSDFQSVPINHEELNKIHEFMFVQSSDGKFHGLTKAFTDLLNGLGYLNK